MNQTHSEIWQRIKDFEIDPPQAQLTFASRLGRENGWSPGFAVRVVHEYKRFVFLAMVAGQEVTPSEQVDEAWHLHLTYTQNYWHGLCGTVLGRPLHHVPTRGGPAENERHREQYRQTLASYAGFFGHRPPTDIWTPVEIRFGEDLNHVRVNRARYWILPKPRLTWPSRRIAPWLAGAWVAPILWGVANPLDFQGPEFLFFYTCISIAAIVVSLYLRKVLRQENAETDERQLTPYEIACLARGVPGVLQSCLAGLVSQGKLQVVKKLPPKIGPISLRSATYKLRSDAQPEGGAHEIESAVLRNSADPSGVDPATLLKSARPIADAVESDLQSRGLLESGESFGSARWWPIAILGAVWLLGLAKLCVGMSRNRPVGFLTIGLFLMAIVIVFFVRRPFRTRRGEELFRELREKNGSLKLLDFEGDTEVDPASLVLAAGLFGLGAIQHSAIKQLSAVLTPVSSGDGGFYGGCGGGGGGCGGGGGGGCGGCGGGS